MGPVQQTQEAVDQYKKIREMIEEARKTNRELSEEEKKQVMLYRQSLFDTMEETWKTLNRKRKRAIIDPKMKKSERIKRRLKAAEIRSREE